MSLDSFANATMRGVVYEGVPYQMTVQDLPVPTILNETDAIVRITTSAICGSDLHIYHGLQGTNPPWGMGHEAVGYISELGSAVGSHEVGDYVVIPDIPSSGRLEMDPLPPDIYGIGSTLDGLQAEYARVPFADESLIPIPLTAETTTPELEEDYLTTADIFATGWTVLDFAGFQSGDTVAVFGAGPVGLMAAYSAILRGATRVYSIDRIPMRLSRAASIGAIPIDFALSDPVAQILAREPGGVRRAVDCVGMGAVNASGQLDSRIVIANAVAVAGLRGGVGQVGVYISQPANTPAAPNAESVPQNISFPHQAFFAKELSWRGGAVDPKLVAPRLVDLVAGGRAKPSFIKSAEIGIEEAPEYYRRFNDREEIKVYIRFP